MIMRDVEIYSHGGLQGEIPGVKGGPPIQTGGTPSGQSGAPLVTWRRVLRTTLGTPSWRGRGVRSTLLPVMHGKYRQNHDFLQFLKILKDCPETSGITLEHVG